jgi:hypothetical protein
MAVLQRINRDAPPFVAVPRPEAKDAKWTEPQLIFEVEFANGPGTGRVRQPSFKGAGLVDVTHSTESKVHLNLVLCQLVPLMLRPKIRGASPVTLNLPSMPARFFINLAYIISNAPPKGWEVHFFHYVDSQ